MEISLYLEQHKLGLLPLGLVWWAGWLVNDGRLAMSKNNIAPLQFPVCHCTPPVQRMWRDSQFRSLVRGGGVPTTGIYLFHLKESSPSCFIWDDGLYLWPTLPERPVLFWFNAAANNVIKVIDKRWCPVYSSQNVYAAAHLSHIYRNFLFCFCCFLCVIPSSSRISCLGDSIELGCHPECIVVVSSMKRT